MLRHLKKNHPKLCEELGIKGFLDSSPRSSLNAWKWLLKSSEIEDPILLFLKRSTKGLFFIIIILYILFLILIFFVIYLSQYPGYDIF